MDTHSWSLWWKILSLSFDRQTERKMLPLECLCRMEAGVEVSLGLGGYTCVCVCSHCIWLQQSTWTLTAWKLCARTHTHTHTLTHIFSVDIYHVCPVCPRLMRLHPSPAQSLPLFPVPAWWGHSFHSLMRCGPANLQSDHWQDGDRNWPGPVARGNFLDGHHLISLGGPFFKHSLIIKNYKENIVNIYILFHVSFSMYWQTEFREELIKLI